MLRWRSPSVRMRCLPRALVRGCGRGRVLVTINYLGVDKTAAATRLLLTLVLGRAESVFCSRCSPASAAPRLRWRRAAPATSAGGGPSALQGSASCRACDRRRRSRARRHPRRDRVQLLRRSSSTRDRECVRADAQRSRAPLATLDLGNRSTRLRHTCLRAAAGDRPDRDRRRRDGRGRLRRCAPASMRDAR